MAVAEARRLAAANRRPGQVNVAVGSITVRFQQRYNPMSSKVALHHRNKMGDAVFDRLFEESIKLDPYDARLVVDTLGADIAKWFEVTTKWVPRRGADKVAEALGPDAVTALADLQHAPQIILEKE